MTVNQNKNFESRQKDTFQWIINEQKWSPATVSINNQSTMIDASSPS